MKRRLLNLVLLLAALLLAILAAGFWLTRSDGGRDFVLAQVQGQLPSGSRLQWQSVRGQLASGLQFQKLSYSDTTQRYVAEQFTIQFALTPLVLRRLQIEQLSASGVRLHLPEDDTPFEFPRWPESLPKLDLPLAIAVERFNIEQLAFFDGKQLLYALSRVHGDIALSPGALRIRQIQADSIDGRIELTGYYLPKKAYATALKGRAQLNTDAASAKPALRFSANGDAKQFVFDASGALPEPVRVRWQLTTQNKAPFWLLSASTERFEPSRLGFADSHAYRMQLAASGNSQRAQVAGEVSRDGQTLIIEPSQLALTDDWLVLEQVRAQFAGASISAKGRLARAGELSSDDLQVRVQNFRLPLSGTEADKTPPVWLDATMQGAGRISQWRLRGSGQLRRGDERADFSLAGTGTERSAVLPKVQVKTAQGGLQGAVKASWSPSLALAFDGQLQRFDPSYFLADFPGAIDARVIADVQQSTDKPWQGTLKLSQVGGNLRGRALAGMADVRFEGLAVSGQADLRIGQSKLWLKGQQGKTRELEARLEPLLLGDLHPDWRGRVQGNLEWAGTLDNPQYRMALRGEDVQALGYRVGRLQLDGDSRARAFTRLTVQDLLLAEQRIDSLDVQLDKHWRDADYRISAKSGTYEMQSNGRVQIAGLERQSLGIVQLRLSAADFGQWQLQAPMTLDIDSGDYRFSPFCLAIERYAARLCGKDADDNIALTGQDFPLALLEPWLNNAGREFTYNGNASMNAQLPKSFDFAGRGFADLYVERLKVAVKPNTENEVARFENVRINAQWLGRQVSGSVNAELRNGGRIEGALSTGFSEAAPLRANLKLQLYELSWLELFSLDIAQPTGQITGEVEVTGSRAAPRINGSYRLQDFNVQIPALGLKLSDGQITATSRDNLALLVRGSIKSGEGRMKVIGVWDPVDQLPQPIDLRLTGQGITLADTPDLQLVADTDLLLGYTGGIYSLNGDVDLVRGLVNLESLDSSVSISNDVVVLDPAPEKAQRDLLRLSLKLKVSANDQVKVRGYGLNGTVSGKVAVNSPFDSPTKLTGTLSLLGEYAAYGQNLKIKRGNLEFANSLVYEPRLDILTEREIEAENITVGLQITGYASKPRTRVVSSQAMSDTDALSWLLFGRPLVAVSAGQASSLNARSMALNAGGSLLVGTLGRQIGLDQASISGSRALGDSTLTIGKQLSPKLFVSYGVSLLGIGQVITLKYLLSKGLDISIETEQTDLREQSSAALNWRK
jgi:translocation and assembly module TamB